jgi:hypothetical protein
MKLLIFNLKEKKSDDSDLLGRPASDGARDRSSGTGGKMAPGSLLIFFFPSLFPTPRLLFEILNELNFNLNELNRIKVSNRLKKTTNFDPIKWNECSRNYKATRYDGEFGEVRTRVDRSIHSKWPPKEIVGGKLRV